MVIMQIYNIHEAKTNLSRLLEELQHTGEPFVIARAGKPLVKVVRLEAEASAPVKRIGFLKGQIQVPDDFDAIGGDDIADLFEGKSQ